MPNPSYQFDPSSPAYTDRVDDTVTHFYRYIMGSEEEGRSLLPEPTYKLVGTRKDVEFVHPRYGLVRATYECYSYKHRSNRHYRWGIESAVQLDPNAPRPVKGQSGNPNLR